MAETAGAGPNPGGQGFIQTYSQPTGFLRAPRVADPRGADMAFLGIPLDLATTFRPGARFGPAAVRAASAQLAELKAFPYGFNPLERLRLVDLGDLQFDAGAPTLIPELIEAAAGDIIDSGVFLLGCGGDHFVTLPLLRAHVARHGPLALVHFDAHPDTWSDNPDLPHTELNHGTMFARAVREGLIVPGRSVQVGIRTWVDDPLGLAIIDGPQVHEMGPAAVAAAVQDRVGDHACYLTVDIDVLDPAFAPGTGTPVAGGLSTAQLLAILRALHGLAIVGSDVVEVAPAYDHAEITALAGATVAFEQVCRLAAAKSG